MSAPSAPKAHPYRTRCAFSAGAPSAPAHPTPYGGGCVGCGGRVQVKGAPDHAAIAEEMAERVSRLTVSHRDPEQFHIEKSEIANALSVLADDLTELKGRGNG